MKNRIEHLIVGTPGGTAGKGAKSYKIALPTAWLTEMGLGADARDVILRFDGSRIVLEKPCAPAEFARRAAESGHEVKTLLYYNGSTLCTRIAADYTARTLCAENYTENPVKTAFGKNALPTWADFLAFLESRCVPPTRAGLRTWLEALGLDEYDPLAIIRKTQGRMAEDGQWLEVTDA